MKRILFVMIALYGGGAEKSLVNLLNELPKEKYEIDLLLFKREGMFLNQVPEHVQILEIPENIKKLYGPIHRMGRFFVPKVFYTLKAKVQEKGYKGKEAYRWKNYYSKYIDQLPGQYDVAIAYTASEVLYFTNEKVCAKNKYVWIHNDYISGGYPREYDYPHLKNMTGIVTISDSCKNILQEVFPEFAHKIYNIANISSSTLIRSRAEEYIPPEYQKETFQILSIGRLGPQKGFHMAIEAAAILKDRGYSFQWTILGSGGLKNSLEEMIKKWNVNDVISLAGTRDNPYPYIEHCDLLAQTSLYEGKSVVLDEAKILATPILATDYPTVHDQIIDNKEGIIVPMSPEGIADGIEQMICNPKKRKEIQAYLDSREYGNQAEVAQYMKLIDGEMNS